MRLIKVDIHRFDDQNSLHLGPLAAGLNAICGPQGSGKTAIASFIRSLMYPSAHVALDRLPHSTNPRNGSMIWMDQSGHHRTSSDRQGVSLTIDPQAREGYWADRTTFIGSDHRSWDNIPVDAYDAIYSGRLGEVSLERLWHAAKKIGIQGRTYVQQETDYHDPRTDVTERISDQPHRSYWEREKAQILLQLDEIDRRIKMSRTSMHDADKAADHRRQELRAELEWLTARESELLRSISGYDAEPYSSKPSDRRTFEASNRHEHSDRRGQLDRIEKMLQQLSQTLPEWQRQIAGLESLMAMLPWNGTTTYLGGYLEGTRTLTERIDRYLIQLETFLQTQQSVGLQAANAPTAPTFFLDLSSCLETIRVARAKLSANDLRSSVEHLNELVSKLRGQAAAIADSIHRETENRKLLVALIADSSAMREAVQGAYTPTSFEPSAPLRSGHTWTSEAQMELERVRARRQIVERELLARADWSFAAAGSPVCSSATLVRDKACLEDQLRRVEERLAVWKPARERTIRTEPVIHRERLEQTLTPLAESYLAELTGGTVMNLPHWARDGRNNRRCVDCCQDQNDRRSSGLHASSRQERQLVELALRLAIVDLAATSKICNLPLILDNAFESYDGDLLDRVIEVLDRFCQRGHQVLLMTRDELVAERVAAVHGGICHLQPYQALNPVKYQRLLAPIEFPTVVERPRNGTNWQDVNQHLQAIANEQEGDVAPAPVPPIARREVQPKSQFYLTLRSPLESAPSIPEAARSILYQHGIEEVGQFMEIDPRELSAWFSDLAIRADSIRDWQAECDLLCHVPNLRPFDARVLVGCGFHSPRLVRRTDPRDLLLRVETFLMTSRGRAIMATASRYELARMQRWLSTSGRDTSKVFSDYAVTSSPDRIDLYSDSVRFRTTESSRVGRTGPGNFETFAAGRSSSNSAATEQGAGSIGRRRSTSSSTGSITKRRRKTTRRSRSNARVSNSGNGVVRMNSRSPEVQSSGSGALRFYLDLDSPIVDAPSIGSVTADKLMAIGVHKVRDLLSTSAQDLAVRLNHPRVSEDEIARWQQQATFVCSVPNLRGHDAQLLVAANVFDVQSLSGSDPDVLLAKVLQVSRSMVGQRILRNSPPPGRDEVVNWISWAQHARTIRAA